MTSLVTVKKEVEKIKQRTRLKPKEFIKLWMAECLIVDKDKIVDTRIDEKGRKWAAIKVECVK